MYVPVYTVIRAVPVCEIFAVVASGIFAVCFVPMLYVGSDLRIDIPLFVEEVNPLIHIYYYMEQQVYTSAGFKHGGNHRHSEKPAQSLVIEFVAALFKFIKHVQCAHHSKVHVYKLCCQIEVTFYIA